MCLVVLSCVSLNTISLYTSLYTPTFNDLLQAQRDDEEKRNKEKRNHTKEKREKNHKIISSFLLHILQPFYSLQPHPYFVVFLRLDSFNRETVGYEYFFDV